jgi:hypothetical protein
MKYLKTFENYNFSLKINIDEDDEMFTISKNENIIELNKDDLNGILDVMNNDVEKYKNNQSKNYISIWKSNEQIILQSVIKDINLAQHIEIAVDEQHIIIDAIDEMLKNE